MAELAPFAPVRAPRNPMCDFRALQGRDPPRCLAPQAPFRNSQGPPALAIAQLCIDKGPKEKMCVQFKFWDSSLEPMAAGL